MTDALFIGEMGPNRTRIFLFDAEGNDLASGRHLHDTADFDGTMQGLAAKAQKLANGSNILAASVVVPGETDHSGNFVKTVELAPWIGRSISHALAEGFDLPFESVGTLSRIEAAATSQAAINRANGQKKNGIVSVLGMEWEAAAYTANAKTYTREAGHMYLREGGACQCGEEGHANAFISSGGLAQNHKTSFGEDWLVDNPSARAELVGDISTAVVNLLHNEADTEEFYPEELRWGGTIASGHRFILQRVHHEVQRRIGTVRTPSFDFLTMGDFAERHGALIDARQRAAMQ